MCAGHFCRLLDLCIGRIQPAIADIFPDRSGKQVRILQHHCDITAQVFSSNLADIHAIHQDFSAVDLVKPVDQVRDRRLARALAKNPKLLLCDEPTGALDYKTGKQVLALLQDTCRRTGRTVIVITHNTALTAMADRIIQVRSGKIVSNQVNEHPVPVQEIEW